MRTLRIRQLVCGVLMAAVLAAGAVRVSADTVWTLIVFAGDDDDMLLSANDVYAQAQGQVEQAINIAQYGDPFYNCYFWVLWNFSVGGGATGAYPVVDDVGWMSEDQHSPLNHWHAAIQCPSGGG